LKAYPLEEELQFLRALIANPRAVGAVAPSSPSLVRAIAAQVDPSQPGPFLELGAGTGAVTRGILARGISQERLTVIERDTELAKSIAAQFGGVHVINGDAFDLERALGRPNSQRFAAVVSGIPLLNHEPEKRRSLLDAALEHAAPGAPFIQFSYGFHSPISPSADITVSMAAFVWKNLPPARVWVYRKR
jgi:phosphatidylethanolamine/phosphatidyl-N-methylethanolamine N-methyltransferase